VGVPSQLAAIPPSTRRRAAAVVGAFAVLFGVVGVLCWVRDSTLALRILGVIVLLAAVVLALIAWGLLNSVRIDRISDELDAEIAEQIAHHDATCGCGQDHDMTEMTTVSGAPPAATTADCSGGGHDGSGTECAHDCDTCTLAALRT
jgi:hypothetical protein